MQSTKRTRGNLRPFFCVRAWWIIGADPVKVRPIRAGAYVPERPAGPIRGQTRANRPGPGAGCYVRRVTSHAPPGHVTRPAGSRSPGPHRTNGNRHRTHQDPKPNRDTPGTENLRHGPGNRTRSDTGSRSGSQEPTRTRQEPPRSASAGPIRGNGHLTPAGPLRAVFAPSPSILDVHGDLSTDPTPARTP